MLAPWIPFSPGGGWALGLDLGYGHEAQGNDELTSAMPAMAIADITQTYKGTRRHGPGPLTGNDER